MLQVDREIEWNATKLDSQQILVEAHKLQIFHASDLISVTLFTNASNGASEHAGANSAR